MNPLKKVFFLFSQEKRVKFAIANFCISFLLFSILGRGFWVKRTEGKNPVAAFANLCCALHPFSPKKDSGPAGRVVSSNQVKNEFTNVET